jgi:hypothetical protein
MPSRVVVASIGLAALAATGVAVNAQASQDTQARSSVSAATSRVAPRITVVERAVSDTVVDIGPNGDSRGDLLAFANPVFNGANSKKVGRDQGSCVRTVVGKAWQCSFTTLLPKGSLVVEGPFYDARDSVLAITGGTGAYSRARGVMHLHARNAKGTAFTFRFVVQG